MNIYDTYQYSLHGRERRGLYGSGMY